MKASKNRVLFVLALALAVSGCGRNSSVDAAKPLQESFRQAEPEAQQAIEQVSSSLKARDYSKAAQQLVPVIDKRRLTDAQQQAVTAMLKQINDAIAADPTLETKELYELRQKMFHTVYGQERF